MMYIYDNSPMQKTTLILIYALIACVLLYITENIYHPVYSVQMIQKIVSFLVIPLVIAYICKKTV
jgi:hypothetical protein